MINREAQLRFLLALLAGAVILAFLIFMPFLAPLALAAVFAVVLEPLHKRILRKLGNRESLAALITVFVTIVCVLVPLTLIGAQIFGEAGQLYGSLIGVGGEDNLIASVIDNLGDRLSGLYPGSETFFRGLSADLDIYAKRGLEWLLSHLGSALSSISAWLLDLFIFFVALYYLLRDGHRLKRQLISLSTLEVKDVKKVIVSLMVPNLIGSGMRLHPLLVLLAVLGGIAFFGPIGIFLGPLTLSLLFAFIQIYTYLAKPAVERGERLGG